jgi:signal transduction histidine kinase
VPLGVAFYLVSARAASEVQAELRRNLAETAVLVDERWATLTGTYTTFARLIADLPKLKAAVETGDPPTVQPLANEYRRQIGADVLIVTAPGGRVLAASGAGAVDLSGLPATGPPEEERSTFVAHPRGLLQLVSVPMVVLGGEPIQVLGRLTVGFFFDDQVAGQFKRLTGSEVAFVAAGRVLATSLPRTERASLAALPGLPTGVVTATRIGVEDFVVERRPLHGASGAAAATEPDALILRSGTEQLRFLNTLRTGLAGALIATVLLATVLSYAVARTMTRPLAAVTSAMSDVAVTGDLSRKVAVRSRTWDDADARLLGTAFNRLTESVARFQREAAQRERLSSLGRLSTVIAHEIRNPLMIIRTSLSPLRGNASPEERREAVADIDEGTRRINRIIGDVLDFARPIRFDFAEADVNEICRTSTAAAWAGDASDDVRLDLDVALPPVVTDAERLRTALVNVLVNARHALAARAEAGDGASRAAAVAVADEPSIIVATRRHDDHVVITIEDHGVGMPPDDLAHIFEPFYTTRRAGTGLGLPIAKNIVEGLGGTIRVDSRTGEGTRIEIDLPRTAPEARV